MTFNPNSALMTGPEWRPTLYGYHAVEGSSKARVARGTPALSETVDALWVPSNIVASASAPARYWLEVYDPADTTPGTVTTTTYVPTGDAFSDNWRGGTGRWVGQPGGPDTSNLFEYIDDTSAGQYLVSADGDDDYGDRYAFHIGTGAFPDSTRVKQVRAYFNASSFGSACDIYFTDDAGASYVYCGSVSFAGGVGVEAPPIFLGESHPTSGLPWTRDDVRDLAVGGNSSFVIVHNVKTGLNLESVRVEIDTVPENRTAIGAADFSAVLTGTSVEFEMQTFTASGFSAGWSKVADQAVELWVRRLSFVGGLSWAYLSGDPCPHLGWSARTVSVDAGGCLVAGSEVDSPAEAFTVLMLVGADFSLDSQPYWRITPAPVATGVVASQHLFIHGDGDYGRVRALVKVAVDATADLSVRLADPADLPTTLAGPETVTAADVDALPDVGGGWKALDLRFDPMVEFLDGDGVVLEFSSTGEWTVAYLDALISTYATPTYGGDDEYATVDGDDSTFADLEATVAMIPYPPSMLTVDLASIPRDTDGTRCAATAISYASLGWEPTVLGADFSAYVLERSDDGGATWAVVQRITDETTVGWHDFEPVRAVVEAQWRITVERSDGTSSDPSDAVALLVPADADWMLVSNEQPDLSLAYTGQPAMTYNPATNGQVERPLAGVDRVSVFNPIEYDGDRFDLPLVVAVIDPTVVGRHAFDPLDDLMNAALTYVCVLNRWGDRWYAALRRLHYDHVESGHRHFATVEVVECATEPTTSGLQVPVVDPPLPVGTAVLVDSTDVSTGFSAAPGTYTPAPGGGDPWDDYDEGYAYIVSVAGLPDIIVWVAAKWATGTPRGVMLFLGGEYGVSWWGGRHDDNELFLQTDVRDQGYDALQVQWQTAAGSLDGWLGAPIGETVGPHYLAARVDALVRQVYADFVSPGTIHNGADRYAVSGQSAGGGALAYLLFDYGRSDIIDVAGNTGANPFGAIEHLASGIPAEYAANPAAREIIDAMWGFEADGLGPAQMNDLDRGYWAWTAGDVDARAGADYVWPTTRFFMLVGAQDDSGSAPAGHDLMARIRAANPGVDMVRAMIPEQGHQLNDRGLRTLGPMLRAQPFPIHTTGRNTGVHDNIDFQFGRRDADASGSIAHYGLVVEGALLFVAHYARTPVANLTTSLPDWTAITPFEINAAACIECFWKIADAADEAASADPDVGLVVSFTTATTVSQDTAGAILWVPPGHNTIADQAWTEPEQAGVTTMTVGSTPVVPSVDEEIAIIVLGTDVDAGGFLPPSQPWEKDYRGESLLLATRPVVDGSSLSAVISWVSAAAAEARLFTFQAP